MLTEGGICLNLNESNYKITIDGLTFYFSSQFYLHKFKTKVKEYIEIESARIYLRYHVNINVDIYLMIAYYIKIEKRGFRIYDNINKVELTKSMCFINQLICY